MAAKEKEWSHDELVSWAARTAHDRLLEKGGAGLRGAMVMILQVHAQWLIDNKIMERKKK